MIWRNGAKFGLILICSNLD